LSSRGRLIIEALKDQLATISTTIGYSVTVRRIIYSIAEMTLNTPETDLPLIEIVSEEDSYNHEGASASYWSELTVILFLVAPKEWTDGMMEDFKSDIIKCLFGGSANATGNSGITLGGVVQSINLLNCRGDLNLVEANRTYVMRLRLTSLRKTYTG
jgi:hypothetical protein